MRHKKVNVPEIVIENLRKKQRQMEKHYLQTFGVPKRIPLTKVMIAVSQKPLFLFDNELKKLPKRRLFKI